MDKRFLLETLKFETILNAYKQDDAQMVDKKVEHILKTKFQRYEKIRLEFHKFFDQDELSSIIDNKADIKMIDRVMDIKASKDELANTEAML